ncbi:MAG: tyrosine-type recombinase/integrase, partial [Rhodobacteraceae bacterium]|nr:tyrosine-type recombinase/integrase [Paracoccaceae bacterium]
IVWTSEEIEKLLAVAPEWVRRIAIAAASTGLRAGDLCKLSRAHIHGDVIQIRTNKRKRMATLPILPELRPIIEATPRNQMLILTSAKGKRLTEHRASEGLRQWGRKAGVNPELRLNDFRGTAATRLVRAGVPLDKVAAYMGWSLRHAQSVIDNYVACDPKNAHDVLVILERERNRKLQTKLQTAHPKEG